VFNHFFTMTCAVAYCWCRICLCQSQL